MRALLDGENGPRRWYAARTNEIGLRGLGSWEAGRTRLQRSTLTTIMKAAGQVRLFLVTGNEIVKSLST